MPSWVSCDGKFSGADRGAAVPLYNFLPGYAHSIQCASSQQFTDDEWSWDQLVTMFWQQYIKNNAQSSNCTWIELNMNAFLFITTCTNHQTCKLYNSLQFDLKFWGEMQQCKSYPSPARSRQICSPSTKKH